MYQLRSDGIPVLDQGGPKDKGDHDERTCDEGDLCKEASDQQQPDGEFQYGQCIAKGSYEGQGEHGLFKTADHPFAESCQLWQTYETMTEHAGPNSEPE